MGEAMQVLHVDDEPAFLDLTAKFLERELDDVEVETASDGATALARLDEVDLDCIVSDYQMPDMGGLELLETVREQRPGLPFVLFTGHGSEQVASNAISAGVTDYLQKGSGKEQFQLLANRIQNAVQAHRTRAAFEESERMVSTLISNLPGMVYRCLNEPDWPMKFVSEGCLDLTGYHPESLESGEVAWGEAVLHEDDRERMWNSVQAALDDGTSFEVTYRVRRRDGEVRWVWEQGRGVYEDGELQALEGFITDVTERVQYERRLDALNDAVGQLLAATDAAECAWVAVDAACKSLAFPFASVRLFDGESEKLTPVAVTDGTAEDLYDRVAFPGENGPAWKAFSTGKGQWYSDVAASNVSVEASAEVRSLVVLPLGAYGTLELASPRPSDFDDTDRNLARILAGNLQSALDRADREQDIRERERELRAQNERLEEFTDIVSHDLRNPLAVVRGQLELGRETGADEHFDRAEDGLARIDNLVSDMLTLAKQGTVVGDTEAVHLAVVAHRAWQAVDTASADLVVESDTGLVADTSRLQQLLENLFANAISHGRGDGPVTVTIGGLTDRDGFYVADDGLGIPNEDRDSVFQPGYSTEPDGTGFGLAIIQQVARAHGWSVVLAESDDGGARFEFTDVETTD